MLFKIKSNPMHTLSDALPVPYVPAHVTRGALVAHRYSFAAPRCTTSQYCRTFVPHSVLLWNDLSDPKSRANPTCWPPNLFFIYVSNFLSLFLPSTGRLCGVGVLGLIGCSHSLPALQCRFF